MARAPDAIDVSHIPDLVRLAKKVAKDRQPRVLQAGGADLAVLSPAPARRQRRRVRDVEHTPNDQGDELLAELERRRGQGLNWADMTAGILKPYAKTPPPTPKEEKDAFEQAVAEQVMEGMRR